MTTLCAQAILIDELLVDGYQFVRAARLQSDAIERRFTQYSQMSGRRFLVSLKEVINSEIILKCWLLIEVDIDFWEKHLKIEVEEFEISINKAFDVQADDIMEAVLDDKATDVAITISNYVARKLWNGVNVTTVN